MDPLLELLKKLSFRKGDFTLTSGKKSDWFIDCKQTLLTSQGHALVAEALYGQIKGLKTKPHAVAGVVLGGCSLASSVSLLSFLKDDPLDAVYVRKNAKSHGTKRLLEGHSHLAPNSPIVVLEDTVTTGGSTLWAIEQIQAASLQVSAVLSVVDRSEGGKEAIESLNIPYASLYNRKDFMP